MLTPMPMVRPTDTEPTALVLAGGGARAAYEVGILDYLFHAVAGVLFLQRRMGVALDRIEAGREVREVPLRKEHALASAAIPMLFPPVRIEGELYCDGGLRPDLPLYTATALGARRLLVVSPHSAT